MNTLDWSKLDDFDKVAKTLEFMLLAVVSWALDNKARNLMDARVQWPMPLTSIVRTLKARVVGLDGVHILLAIDMSRFSGLLAYDPVIYIDTCKVVESLVSITEKGLQRYFTCLKDARNERNMGHFINSIAHNISDTENSLRTIRAKPHGGPR